MNASWVPSNGSITLPPSNNWGYRRERQEFGILEELLEGEIFIIHIKLLFLVLNHSFIHPSSFYLQFPP